MIRTFLIDGLLHNSNVCQHVDGGEEYEFVVKDRSDPVSEREICSTQVHVHRLVRYRILW